MPRPDSPSLLAVVDMQRVFAREDSPWSVPGFSDLEGPVRCLLRHFGPRAVFTRFVPPSHPVGAWREYYRAFPFALDAGGGLWDLEPPWDDYGLPVLAKPTFSAWGEELKRMVGDGTLVLAGVSTECCALATAVGAADAGVPVRIVRDACASVDLATHEAALRAAEAGFAPIVAVTTVEEEVAGLPAS